jgi:hypothetical protein
VYQSEICRRGFRSLTVGEEVEFWVEVGEGGRVRARKVTSPGEPPWEDRPKKSGGKHGTKKGLSGGAESMQEGEGEGAAAAGGAGAAERKKRALPKPKTAPAATQPAAQQPAPAQQQAQAYAKDAAMDEE